jgi:hypothetical protein
MSDMRLNPKLVELVSSEISGKRLEKFLASVKIINDSLSQSGFYQGLTGCLRMDRDYSAVGRKKALFELASSIEFCLSYGRPIRDGYTEQEILDAIQLLRSSQDSNKNKPISIKVTDAAILAWIQLCTDKAQASAYLTSLRPKPKLTKILLSPKVTKTLIEMHLDLDIQSIVPAKIVRKHFPAFDKTGKPLFLSVEMLQAYIVYAQPKQVPGVFSQRCPIKAYDSKGKPLFSDKEKSLVNLIIPVVEWSKGIKFNRTRFTCGCEACGKRIPSRRFVPVEARDKKSNDLIGMWLGCDCASNIFGIKDKGIGRSDL